MDFSCAQRASLFRQKSLVPPTLPENRTKRKPQNHSELENNSGVFNTVGGGEPVLCLQKGILSPSCLPAFGKVAFLFVVSFDFSLRERFFLREREGFALFDKTILPHFPPHVNHVKLFHTVVLDLRSVRDPGLPPRRSPCPDALLRVGVMRGGIMGWLVY